MEEKNSSSVNAEKNIGGTAADLKTEQGELLSAPREFFVEVDSLLSWVAHRGWQIRSDEDKKTCQRLYLQAREIYERPPANGTSLRKLSEQIVSNVLSQAGVTASVEEREGAIVNVAALLNETGSTRG